MNTFESTYPDKILRISNDLHQALKSRAVHERTSMTKLGDKALREWLGLKTGEAQEGEGDGFLGPLGHSVLLTPEEEFRLCDGNPGKEAAWYEKHALNLPGEKAPTR